MIKEKSSNVKKPIPEPKKTSITKNIATSVVSGLPEHQYLQSNSETREKIGHISSV
jgi:hypothetical protein